MAEKTALCVRDVKDYLLFAGLVLGLIWQAFTIYTRFNTVEALQREHLKEFQMLEDRYDWRHGNDTPPDPWIDKRIDPHRMVPDGPE